MRKRKFRLGLLLVLSLVFTNVVPVVAQTVEFKIKVGASDGSNDPISKRALKADDEQRFYVTPTSATTKATITAVSHKLNGYYTSNIIIYNTGSDINRRREGTYPTKAPFKPAPSGVYYYMSSSFEHGYGPPVVKGRYTP